MLCIDCKNKNICKIFDSTIVSGVTIEIKDCIHYINNISLNTYDNINNNIPQQENTIPVVEKSRAMQDITKLSNELRGLNKNNKYGDIKEIDIEDEKLPICSNCDEETMLITECPVCGKEICSSCCAIDISGGTEKIMCEECLYQD